MEPITEKEAAAIDDAIDNLNEDLDMLHAELEAAIAAEEEAEEALRRLKDIPWGPPGRGAGGRWGPGASGTTVEVQAEEATEREKTEAFNRLGHTLRNIRTSAENRSNRLRRRIAEAEAQKHALWELRYHS